MKYFVLLIMVIVVACESEIDQSRPSDIYVVGYAYVPDENSSVRYNAAYWRNNELTLLPGGLFGSFANYIAFIGEDTIVAGSISDFGYDSKPVIWLNGTMTELPWPDATSKSFPGFITDLQVANNDFFVTGSIGPGYAVLWKNFELIELEDASSNSAFSVTINNNDVYVGGNGGYWLNSKFVSIENAASRIKLDVFKGDIYACGAISNVTIDANGNPINKLISGYWKNNNDFKPLALDGYADNLIVDISINSLGDVFILGMFSSDNIWREPSGNTSVIWKNGTVERKWEEGNSGVKDFKIYKDKIYAVGAIGKNPFRSVYWEIGDDIKSTDIIEINGGSPYSIFLKDQ